MTNPGRSMNKIGKLHIETQGWHATAWTIHAAACHGGAKTEFLGHAAACPIHAAAWRQVPD